MKKLKIFILLLIVMLLTCSCSFKKTSLDNANIYTTVYPVNYIVNYLYKDSSKISSIYPSGVDLNNYSLTDKQIAEYASGDLFVYVGLGSEKDIAKSFVNKNNDLLIIDATYGLNYSEDIKELWLAPNNFLMLCKNIKNSLNEYLNNTLKEDEVSKLYDELYAEVSWIDAELREVAKEAKENKNNTIVVATNTFKYLENYGFDVISLEDIEKNGTENTINEVKNNFKNSKYNAIIKLKSDEGSELVKEITSNNKVKVIEIDDMITNDDPSTDYVSIQYANIATLRELLVD